MSASLIIVSYRTGPALAQCLAAAVRAEGVGAIIIVDNGNPPEDEAAMDRLAAEQSRVRVLRGHGNVGFARACNRAAALAPDDVLIFANPDVVLNASAPAQLAEAVAAAAPALVGGDLRGSDGAPERGSRRERLTLWRAFVSVSGLSRLERWWPAFRDFNRHDDPVPAGPERVGCISGALFAMRKADYEAIGGMDEGYFLHVEDVDLCRRVEERGWPVLFLPGPHGVHLRSSSRVAPHVIAVAKARGMARYFQKFGANPLERGLARFAGALLSLGSLRP